MGMAPTSQGPSEKGVSQKDGEADRKRALGWEIKTDKHGGEKEIVTWARNGGLGYVCPIPYGQFKVPLSLSHMRAVKKYWHDIERKCTWPKDLLGFEAWCGMTNFDDSKADGGMAFQKLMLQVLGQQMSSTPKEHDLTFESMWDANACTYGAMFNTDDGYYGFENTPPDLWFEGVHGNGSILGGVYTEEWESTGAHLSKHSRPLYLPATENKPKVAESMGMQLGNHSGASKVINPGVTFVTNSNHYDIYSKHDWAVKGMLQTGTAGSCGAGSQTLGQGLVSSGVDKITAWECWEVTALDKKADTPCMLMQNSLAAVYGLYYYNGCNNSEYNWAVQETVHETTPPKTFQIRFRCPNPKYGPVDWYKKKTGAALETNGGQGSVKNLFVREPLNHKNKAFLDKYIPATIKAMNVGRTGTATEIPNSTGRRTHTYVGGTHGENNNSENKFVVPKIQRISQHPTAHPLISPWAYVVNNNKAMQVAPFWNKGYSATDVQKRKDPTLVDDEQASWHGLKAQNRMSFERGRKFRENDIMVAGEMINDVAFGFRISQAFILYPHYGKGEYVTRDWVVKADPVSYMTEPKWKANPVNAVAAPLASHVLDWDEWQ
jgi:hypothetical protein